MYTHDFVCFVGTIEVAVATPVQRNAVIVFDASEFGLQTSDVRAVKFVRAVLTVIVSVAHPKFLDALAVSARELVVPTRFVWVENNESRSAKRYDTVPCYYKIIITCGGEG